MTSIWGELKRRNVVRVAIAYAVVAWLSIEVSATTFPMLKLRDKELTKALMDTELGALQSLCAFMLLEMSRSHGVGKAFTPRLRENLENMGYEDIMKEADEEAKKLREGE